MDGKEKSQLKNLKVNKDKYKIKFTLTTKQQAQETDTDFCVRILKVAKEAENEEQKYAIEFQKLKGDQHSFHTHYTDIVNNVLASYNDITMDTPVIEGMWDAQACRSMHIHWYYSFL